MAEQKTRKVYVANLSWTVNERMLRDRFTPFGEIEQLDLIRDNYTGKSQGFAFITFHTFDQAREALSLDAQMFDHRPMRVDFAIERTSEDRRQKRRARRLAQHPDTRSRKHGAKHGAKSSLKHGPPARRY